MEKKTVSVKSVFIEFMNVYQSNATIAYRFSRNIFAFVVSHGWTKKCRIKDMAVINASVSNKFMSSPGVYNKKKFTVPTKNNCHFQVNGTYEH